MTLHDYYPNHPPIYDIQKSYAENVELGPFFNGAIPKRVMPPRDKWIDFLGNSLASPLGVAAGPLLTAKWVKLAADLGFDLLTYKTIRTHKHPSHPLPNMIYVDTEGQIEKTGRALHQAKAPPKKIELLGVTNSFGMPSQSPDFLLEDIALANSYMREGQLLIISVVGSPQTGHFLKDFIDAAVLAKDAGARVIEANFSCPNVDKKEGCLYMSQENVALFASAIVKAIHPIPLILKMGLFNTKEEMQRVLLAAARAGVRGVCGINTISRAVIDDKGEPALGASRLTSGICGGPIRNAALAFIRDLATINSKEQLGLSIMGVGGITLPEHFDLFLLAGADIALTATGMMWDPYLAMRYHHG